VQVQLGQPLDLPGFAETMLEALPSTAGQPGHHAPAISLKRGERRTGVVQNK
jgi:hypothetical protein